MTTAKESLSGLNLEQRAALEKRLLSRRSASVIPKLAGPKPLSPSQESLWITEQLAEGSPLYNIPAAFRVRGPLEVDALGRSFAEVVRRHDSLRTRFSTVDEQPQQTVLEMVDFRIHYEDLTAHPEALPKLLEDIAKKPFQLSDELLLRVYVFKLAPEEHVVAVNLHHLISDNSSLGLLFQEVSELCQGRALPMLPVQFPDLAAFQRNQTDAKAVEFWKQRMNETAERRQAPQSFRGAWRPVTIPAPLVSQLKHLGQSQNATLYMTLLAAFYTLLHRVEGTESITVGSPVGQRDYPGAEGMIGMLINTLPLRIDLAREPSFIQLLQRVRQETLECYRHAKTSFDGGRHPVFHTVFQLITAPAAALALPGTTVEEIPLQTGTSKFDLTFTLMENGGALTGNVEFATDNYDAAAVDRLISHYQILLESIVRHPEEAIGRLLLMPDEKKNLIVSTWNQTETKYPRHQAVHQLFEAQARRTPEATALRFGSETMTYGALNARANAMAKRLQELGVGSGYNVAICLERSFDLMASLLAALKTGAAYVPLDSEYPAARLSYILNDSAAKLIITTAKFRAHLPSETASLLVENDFANGGEPSAVEVSAEDPAYIMYTSGSTGEPKGVVIPHRGIVRLVQETNYATFGRDEIFLQFAPVSFDAATFEIWGALLNGATLAIYPARFDSLEQFEQVLRQYGVTTLWLTAGLFHQVVDHHIDALRGLRQLLAGGDVLSPRHVEKVLRLLPCALINGYGPTENTTFTCCYRVPRNWSGSSVPIGRPVSNTRVYILDKYLQPVPVGMSGELWIAGDGLALGYLNSPELTAAKFVNDPFAPETGGKLYRTGDLARYGAEGDIEFLGRMDNQVKVRGFRVELGEIEHALQQHPGVRATVVTRELAAYFVPQPGVTVEAQDLRDWLAGRLPAHMIPTHFIGLTEFPLTPNGKVDRRKLPAPARDEIQTAPRNETEQKLAEIWKEALGVPQVGVHQNFFELGGHSLLAMRVLSRVNQVFGVAMPLRDMFAGPTIAKMAEKISNGKSEPGTPLIARRARRAATVTKECGAK